MFLDNIFSCIINSIITVYSVIMSYRRVNLKGLYIQALLTTPCTVDRLFFFPSPVTKALEKLREGNETGRECETRLKQLAPIHRRAPSLARLFARLFDLRLEMKRKRLLRRLRST